MVSDPLQHGITEVDLMSVDVEGAAETVLGSIDWQAVIIRAIAVEGPSQKVTGKVSMVDACSWSCCAVC